MDMRIRRNREKAGKRKHAVREEKRAELGKMSTEREKVNVQRVEQPLRKNERRESGPEHMPQRFFKI